MVDAATVTLLLCSSLGTGRRDGLLGPREYDQLLQALDETDRALTSLMDGTLWDLADLPIGAERLQILLGRFDECEVAVERWKAAGIWWLTVADEGYPPSFRELGSPAPPILFGVGDPVMVRDGGPALAIVGARHVDACAAEFADRVARNCARCSVRVVSGGARGVDAVAMLGAVEEGGDVVGVLSYGLLRAAKETGRSDRHLLLLSASEPEALFSIGMAMARNKLIYALADAALVVVADEGRGGTWAGAAEALKRGRPPVFVRWEEGVPPGNGALLELGARRFIPAWLDSPGCLFEDCDAVDVG